ncbi:MAG: ATP-binding cassette domain-containing protein [Sporichthyaceae bacterium]
MVAAAGGRFAAAPQAVGTAGAALAAVGLDDRLEQRTSTLSGGEQQRVAIARVLVQRPALLLADEPVSNLDPARSAEVAALLHRVARDLDATLIVGLHDLGLVRAGFDRVVALRDGRVAFDVPAARLTSTMTDALYEPGPGQPRSASSAPLPPERALRTANRRRC